MQRTRDWRRHQWQRLRARNLRRYQMRNGPFEIDGDQLVTHRWRWERVKPYRRWTTRYISPNVDDSWVVDHASYLEWLKLSNKTKKVQVKETFRHVNVWTEERHPTWREVDRYYRWRRCRCDWCVTPYNRHARRSDEYKKALDVEGL